MKRPRLSLARRLLLTSLLIPGCWLASETLDTSDAMACGNATRMQLDRAVPLLKMAEKQLRGGLLRPAIRTANKVRFRGSGKIPRGVEIRGPKARGGKVERPSRPVQRARAARTHERRARLITAIAIVRSHGKWDHLGRLNRRKKAKNRSLKRAISRLVSAGSKPKATNVTRARWAEALEAKKKHSQAFKILNELSENDLMPDSWAFGALARLQHRRGDTVARDNNALLCKVRSRKNKKKFCPQF